VVAANEGHLPVVEEETQYLVTAAAATGCSLLVEEEHRKETHPR
jgi:hypothetical protein